MFNCKKQVGPEGRTGIEILGINDHSIEEIVIPHEICGYPVESIGWDAFCGCSSLSNVTIPDSVISIGNGAFRGCYSLSSITIPDSVRSIGIGAFEGCSSLSNVIIPDGVSSIIYKAFNKCSSLSSITIPDSVRNIDDGAFEGCSSLSNVTIPDSVIDIGEKAFEGCSSLSNVTIPDSVINIGEKAFESCYNLRSITIPDSVKWIGERAFYRCYSLRSVTIPDSVISIGEKAFERKSLSMIWVPKGSYAEKWVYDNGYGDFLVINIPKMKENIEEFSILFDFYGGLLDEQKKEIFHAYIMDDLSPDEIAQNADVSIQSVINIIKNCYLELTKYENKLGLVKRFYGNKADVE